jgi:dipeptidyl aminopeptidase/acylaminoacyl peptidase
MKLRFFLILCLFSLNSFAQQKGRILVTDLYQIRTASNIKFSPDGKWYVYSVQTIVANEEQKAEYDYQYQWFLAPADLSTSPRAITNNKENTTGACWSADGKQLFFARMVKGKSQLFSLSLDGGEAKQLTDFRYGAGSPAVSPDGKILIFTASLTTEELLKDSLLNADKKLPVWNAEKPGLNTDAIYHNSARGNADGTLKEIRAYLQQNEKEKKAKVFNRLNFQGEAATNPELRYNHLFSLPLLKADAAPVAITGGFYSYSLADISPDGRFLIINADLNPSRHPDRSQESAIYRVPITGGTPELLLSATDYRYSAASISPDGKWISYQSQPANGVNVSQAFIYHLDGKEKIRIPLDRSMDAFNWSRDNKFLYFLSASNGGNVLYRYNLTGKSITCLSDFDSGITSFDISKTQLAYTRLTVADPSEVYVADLLNKKPKASTQLNTAWLATKQLNYPVKKTFRNELGMEVEYWVMKPGGMEGGRKYPVMLEIHGGPAAMWGPGEASMWHEFQYYTGMGYGVVYSNPRGSGGYGETFLRGNVKDWGDGPTRDVLRALDLTIAEGWADTTQQFITGGSYAGYLTAWIVGHTNRFSAACAQRGVYDLTTFFGEGNAWRLVPNYFGGYPWERSVAEMLRAQSPFTYVDQIHTPLIIFHGENDLRTGVIQSEMMYKALKVLGRDVEYVRHPGGTHELTRSGNNRQRVDQMLRTMEFFERYKK